METQHHRVILINRIKRNGSFVWDIYVLCEWTKKAIYLNKLDLLLSTCHFLWFNALDIVKIGM